jgi:DNA-binding MarR family transcriptional regulator
MGLLPNAPEEIPVSSVQHPQSAVGACERAIKDIEQFKQHIAALEGVQSEVRAQAALESDLSLEALRVLVHMYITENARHRDVGVMARKLKMGREALQGHLGQLCERGLAESGHGSHRLGHLYWELTPQGRQYVVRRRLA